MENYEDRDWNEDIAEDIKPEDVESIVVSSRDWTVETIVSQIQAKNIDLNPKFQRRNAWTDTKRSKLIESLIIGVPVPEIVLAEDPKVRKSFIVIDGKQRLLTIAGFIDPKENPYWQTPRLVLKSPTSTRPNPLDGLTYSNLTDANRFRDAQRQFLNADIRCTIISNYTSDDILYDIFYRLNTSSVPLSTQELRQVLVKGDFANYLIEITSTLQPIHRVLGLDEPDSRLRDAEMILRFLSIVLFGDRYRNNLKTFLDVSMREITQNWGDYKPRINSLYSELNDSIELLIEVLGEERVGRRFANGKWQRRFNKVLFEVEAYYFLDLLHKRISKKRRTDFVSRLAKLCENRDFALTIESSTKTNERYDKRFTLFGEMMASVFNIEPRRIPIENLSSR